MTKIDKLFRDKKGNRVIYILLVMGIMLMIFGSSLKKEPTVTVPTPEAMSRTTQAEKILSEIKGAGRVSVMISEEDGKKSSVLISDEKERGALSGGVLIVAEGAHDGAVCERLIRAASVALGVEPHKIEVFERKE